MENHARFLDTHSLAEQLYARRVAIRNKQKALMAKIEATGGQETPADRDQWDRWDSEFVELGDRLDDLLTGEEHDRDLESQREPFNPVIRTGGTMEQNEKPRNPLAVTGEMLDAVQHAFDNRLTGVFEPEMHAALTTSTYGAPRDWGSNILSAPRTLWETAGIPSTQAGGPTAQFPKLTLAAVDAGVGEGVTLVEYATSTGGTVTLKRYGRYTDFTMESLVGADAGAVLAAHRTAIARDLDSALIGLVNTDAGSAVAFTADVPAAIRKAIALVGDATAAPDGRMVVLAHPDNVALLQNVTSTGGETIGEDFPKFAGALVYASSAVPTGFMLVANLASACRFWSAGSGVQTQTFQDVKTGVLSAGTQIFAGFGTGAISSYVSKVDVVTP